MNDGITLDQFRSNCVDFCKEVDTLDSRSLEAAWSAIGKQYLGVTPATDLNIMLAKGALEYASRRYWKRRTILDFGSDPLDDLRKLVGMKA